MIYRLINDPEDYRAYEEAQKRGEDVYLMKVGKGPSSSRTCPKSPKTAIGTLTLRPAAITILANSGRKPWRPN